MCSICSNETKFEFDNFKNAFDIHYINKIYCIHSHISRSAYNPSVWFFSEKSSKICNPYISRCWKMVMKKISERKFSPLLLYVSNRIKCYLRNYRSFLIALRKLLIWFWSLWFCYDLIYHKNKIFHFRIELAQELYFDVSKNVASIMGWLELGMLNFPKKTTGGCTIVMIVD